MEKKTNDTMSEKRTVTPSQSAKRERSDDVEPTARRVLQRTDETKESKVSIQTIVLDDLWSNDEVILKRSMRQLMLDTNDDDDEKRAEKQKQFYRVGGHLAVVKAMNRNIACGTLQLHGIAVLVNATYQNLELKMAIAEVGGTETIVDAMKFFPTEGSIIRGGLKL